MTGIPINKNNSMTSNLTPLQPFRSRSLWHLKTRLPAVIFLLGLTLAAAGALIRQHFVSTEAEVDFQRTALQVSSEINQRFQRPILGLNGLKSVYATHPKVKRAEFRAAVESRNLAKEFPGVRGFGFIEQVMRADLGAFIAAERADGAPQFNIRQLIDKDLEDLFVIKLIEPASANVGARGLDIGSEAMRRAAAQQAVDTGQPVMTKAIMLVQDQRSSPGVLMYVPVYAQGADMATVPERRGSLVGLLYAPIVIHELLEGLNAVAASRLDFELIQSAPDSTLLFTTNQRGPQAGMAQVMGHEPRFVNNQQARIGGQDLTLRMTSTPEFEAHIDHITPWLVLAAGTVLSALLAFVLRQFATGQRRAELLAEHMTMQLRHDEERARDFSACASDWSWETNAQHHFCYLSSNFELVYGLSPYRVLGKRRQDLWAFDAMNPPDAVNAYLTQIEAHLPIKDFEYQTRHNDGKCLRGKCI